MGSMTILFLSWEEAGIGTPGDSWGQGASAALLAPIIVGPEPHRALLLCSTPPLSTAPMYGVSRLGEGTRSHTLEQESPWQII